MKKEIKENLSLLNIIKFSCLGYIGSMINISGTMLSFHTFPAYFASMHSGIEGAIVGFITTMFFGIYGRIPYDLGTRALVALSVGLIAYAFHVLKKKTNPVIAMIICSLLNGTIPVALLIGSHGMEFFKGVWPVITMVAFFNIFLAVIVSKALEHPDQKGVIASWLKSR